MKIDGKAVHGLVDTGASKSVIHPSMLSDQSLQLSGVNLRPPNGEEIVARGPVDVDLEIGLSTVLCHDFLVAETEYSLILGFDFLSKHSCRIDARRGTLVISRSETGGTVVKEFSPYRIICAETVAIPAGREMLIAGAMKEETEPAEFSFGEKRGSRQRSGQDARARNNQRV